MTATGTTTTETLSSQPPVRPPRGALIAVGLGAFAAVALTPWLLTTSSPTEAGPITPTSAAALPLEATLAAGQVSAGWYVGTVDRPEAYVQFCQNSPVLCDPTAPTPPDIGYVLFCENSPVLCISTAPVARPR
jgi:hypothetical protein